MRVKGILKNIRGFVPDIPYIEEEVEDVEFSMEADENESVVTKDTSGKLKILHANPLREDKFSAFIDGTYRIAKIGYFYGVPIYVSNITAALLTRDQNGYLHDFGPIRNLFVVLYPFESMYQYAKLIKGDIKMAEEVLRFKELFKENYEAKEDYEIRRNTLNVLLEHESLNVWILGDISYLGLDRKNREEGNLDIEPNEVFNISKISQKARARTRVLMGILEATYLRAYRERYGNDEWVLMDGTLNYAYKFSLDKKNESEKFEKYFKKTVGFVKTIRRRVFATDVTKFSQLLSMGEGEYIITLGIKNDTEELELRELGENIQIGRAKWGFVYLRFRFPRHLLPGKEVFGIYTPKGIIKAQFYIPRSKAFDNEIAINYALDTGMKIADMIFYERFPFPSDKRRLWNETLAIEETEKVAKSRLMSKEYLEHLGQVL